MQKISDFINSALFHPAFGYYRVKNPIGKTGDFITSPEISQVFGELIAAYLIQIASHQKTKIALVEMGAGKGTLFKDILGSIKKLAEKYNAEALDFLNLTTFHIVEINQVLTDIQKKNLKAWPVKWYENFADFVDSNSDREIFFVSNELFDFFAIDQYVQTEEGWRERVVQEREFILADFDKKVHDFVEKEVDSLAPIGAVFEYSVESRNFMKQLCEALKKQGGIAIIIDYGFIKNKFANTLQAIKNHKKCDVLEAPGEADITALVDFNSLQKIVKNIGLNQSIVSQAHFLISLGIEERRTIMIGANPKKAREINSAIDRLIGLDQMGELFKCLIVWK